MQQNLKAIQVTAFTKGSKRRLDNMCTVGTFMSMHAHTSKCKAPSR